MHFKVFPLQNLAGVEFLEAAPWGSYYAPIVDSSDPTSKFPLPFIVTLALMQVQICCSFQNHRHPSFYTRPAEELYRKPFLSL